MSSRVLQIAAAAESTIDSGRRGLVVDARLEQREDDDPVLSRAGLLRPEDRAVVEGFYGRGMTAGQLARLMCVHEGTVRRRTRALLRHLRSPLFSFILAHRGQWSADRRRVAEMHLLQRRTLRETARLSELTMHRVRREADAVRAQFEAFRFESCSTGSVR